MTISRTSSRKSAPNFTSKRQRQAHKPVRNLDPNRARVPAPKKAQANAAKETASTRSSKSSTKTRDKVLISKYGGTEIKIDNESYLIMREDDILGIIG